MRSRFGLCLALALVLPGCRGGGTALLERELRMQEDNLYQLQDKLDQCQAMLESSQRENQSLKLELAGGDPGAAAGQTPARGAAGSSIEMPRGPSSPKRRTPLRKQRPADPETMPDFREPVIEPGIPIGPGDSTGAAEDGSAGLGTGGRGTTLRGPGGAKQSPADERVTAIVLNKQLTGGRNHSSPDGDNGLMLVFEARNAAGRAVKVPGDVSIAAIDPSQQGAAARVARWDFEADEILPLYRSTALSEGFHFELPWPSAPPKSKSLRLFVRYTTRDGRKLTADQTIKIDPPRRQTKNWTPAAKDDRESQPAPREVVSGSNPPPPSTANAPAPATRPAPVAKPTPAVAERPVWKPYR